VAITVLNCLSILRLSFRIEAISYKNEVEDVKCFICVIWLQSNGCVSILFCTGKLFRTSDLWKLVEFILLFHTDKPGDWLLSHFFSKVTLYSLAMNKM